MIHYSLVCDADHGFEGWFRSSADFDRQVANGFVACPICGSAKVGRALMAPNVQSGRAREARAEAVAAEAPPARRPMMVADPAQKEMLRALRDLKAKIVESADYVGDRFADEARRMHYGETEHRGIYGEASHDEAKALAEEGIEFQPLPVLPDDRN